MCQCDHHWKTRVLGLQIIDVPQVRFILYMLWRIKIQISPRPSCSSFSISSKRSRVANQSASFIRSRLYRAFERGRLSASGRLWVALFFVEYEFQGPHLKTTPSKIGSTSISLPSLSFSFSMSKAARMHAMAPQTVELLLKSATYVLILWWQQLGAHLAMCLPGQILKYISVVLVFKAQQFSRWIANRRPILNVKFCESSLSWPSAAKNRSGLNLLGSVYIWSLCVIALYTKTYKEWPLDLSAPIYQRLGTTKAPVILFYLNALSWEHPEKNPPFGMNMPAYTSLAAVICQGASVISIFVSLDVWLMGEYHIRKGVGGCHLITSL